MSNGSIALTITDMETAQDAVARQAPRVIADVRWTGELGRNDEGEFVRVVVSVRITSALALFSARLQNIANGCCDPSGRAPYFKLGVYDPSGNLAKLKVEWREFKSAFGIVDPEGHLLDRAG